MLLLIPKPGSNLARFVIEFEGGVLAYIPLDNNAADRLRAKGLPVFPFRSFALNEDLKILMPMTQAIELGILDVETVESIRKFPTACQGSRLDVLASTQAFLCALHAGCRCTDTVEWQCTAVLGAAGAASERQTPFVTVGNLLRATPP